MKYGTYQLGHKTSACAILGTLMVIVFPRLTREIMDVVIPRGQMERLPGLIALGLGAYFLQDLLTSLRIQINNTFEQKVIFDLRSSLYERLQRLPLRWFRSALRQRALHRQRTSSTPRSRPAHSRRWQQRCRPPT